MFIRTTQLLLYAFISDMLAQHQISAALTLWKVQHLRLGVCRVTQYC